MPPCQVKRQFASIDLGEHVLVDTLLPTSRDTGAASGSDDYAGPSQETIPGDIGIEASQEEIFGWGEGTVEGAVEGTVEIIASQDNGISQCPECIKLKEELNKLRSGIKLMKTIAETTLK